MSNKKIEIEWNGHFYSKDGRFKKNATKRFAPFLLYPELGHDFHLFNTDDCPQCGEEVTAERVGKHKLRITTPCKYPEGLPPYSVFVNIPSGKIIFDNSLHDLISLNSSYNINLPIGCKITSEAYANAKMIHIYVGNTCPGIHQLNDKEIHIISEAYDEELDKSVPYSLPSTLKGRITTDLWWYSAMDYDLFKKISEEKYGADSLSREEGTTVVNVIPGLYEITGLTHINRSRTNWKKEELFSTIKRISDCKKLKPQSKHGEVKEFLSESLENTINVKWLAYNDSLFPDRETVLRNLLLGYGSGYDWEGGIIRISVDERIADAVEKIKQGFKPVDKRKEYNKEQERIFGDILAKNRKSDYYSKFPEIAMEYSPIATIPDNVQQEWLQACREIIDAVIKEETEETISGRNNIECAKKIKVDIEKRFG